VCATSRAQFARIGVDVEW